jgi:LuxR family maltose regulon positive regulatory protein
MTNPHELDNVLLQTKLNQPGVTRDLVVRPRLEKMLERGVAGPLTLVVAPAGFGKTTLVSSWLRERSGADSPPTPAAWLTLDEGDQDRVILLRYFIGALRTIFPDACPMTLNLVNSREDAPTRLLSDMLINELELLPSPFILALDDFYTIRDQTVLDFVNDFVQHWPRRMHMIILSRHDPPLPLAALRARGVLTEIRVRDLRFSSEETAEYFSHSFGDSPDESSLSLLQQQLEGWIAGLKMITLSMGGRYVPRALNSALQDGDVYITDYLVDEVNNVQPPAIQRFLMTVSIVDRFSASLCEALIAGDGDCDARACLDYIATKDLFVTPLDSSREWYRFHRIFRDFLRRRLADTLTPQQLEALHGRAAQWFAAHDLPDQAIYHALRGGDIDMAARVMIDGLRDVLNREDRPTLERWLQLLPEAYIRQNPDLLVMRGWAHAIRWDYEQLAAVLEQIQALLDAGKQPALTQLFQGQLATVQGHYAYFFNQYDQAVTYCRNSLALLPEDWRYARSIAGTYLSLSLYSIGRAELAEKFITEQYGLRSQTGLDGEVLRLLISRTINAIHAAHYEAAERTAKTLVRQATTIKSVLQQSWGLYLLGLVSYEWNDVEGAARQFSEGLDVSFGFNLIAWRNAMIGLTFAAHALGDGASALETINQLSQMDLESHGVEADDTAAARARLMLMIGDTEAAERWADQYNTPLARDTLAPLMGRPQLTKARILIARNAAGDLQTATGILNEFDKLAASSFNVRVTIEVLALRALAKLAQGDSAGARECLIRAVELSRRGLFTRTFVDLGPQMQKLLQQIAGHGPTMKSVSRLLAAFEGGPATAAPAPGVARWDNAAQPPDAADGLYESLTPREREILALMAEPIGLKVIAGRMNITYATARRYTISIYDKFDVHSRWEAIDYAVRNGIISSR